VTKFSETIKTEGAWRLERDANKMWEEMAKCIRRSTKEVLGVSKGEVVEQKELGGGAKR